jgi:hypothetical protein
VIALSRASELDELFVVIVVSRSVWLRGVLWRNVLLLSSVFAMGQQRAVFCV